MEVVRWVDAMAVMINRRLQVGIFGVVGVVCAGALPAVGQERPYELVAHSDSAYAGELTRLQQMSVMQAQEAGAKGTAAENLWKAQLIVARWDELTKDR